MKILSSNELRLAPGHIAGILQLNLLAAGGKVTYEEKNAGKWNDGDYKFR